MAHKPFPPKATRTTNTGELIHMDLWGKYQIKSIHGNQYYILFIDDYSRYITVNYLKSKTEATQKVQDYLTHISARNRNPLAIRMDRGMEFINKPMKNWCSRHSIEIQMTAPYSPSQNGVAEQMNQTMVELARAMITTWELPEFLWKPATAHAAYLRNRSFSSSVPDATPYERWHGEKPDVSHIRELGSKVVILDDGPHKPRKMLPKASDRMLVGLDNGARAVKYYNKDTRKILTSRSYRLVNTGNTLPPEDQTNDPPDQTREKITETVPEELEPEKDTPVDLTSELQKRKADDEINQDHKRTRGVKLDYKRLDNPFSDTDDDEDFMIMIQLMINDESYNAAVNDRPISLTAHCIIVGNPKKKKLFVPIWQ
jgi:hypothetical protein